LRRQVRLRTLLEKCLCFRHERHRCSHPQRPGYRLSLHLSTSLNSRR
jgi:hypothetical protein